MMTLNKTEDLLAKPRFIYITGCDGTGKSTQARLLVEQLRNKGLNVKHIWLRFPFIFSLPMLFYARLRGFSWFEETDNVKHGYWDFRRSWFLCKVFPWVLLADATLAALWHIYLPLWAGSSIVCERFVLDMLVDLSIACGNSSICRSTLGNFFINLIPLEADVFVLDLDESSIRSRRMDLRYDHKLVERLEAYHYLTAHCDFVQISSLPSVEHVNKIIRLEIGLKL
jgi:hypothetical protein